jgi:hypothetical protein
LKSIKVGIVVINKKVLLLGSGKIFNTASIPPHMIFPYTPPVIFWLFSEKVLLSYPYYIKVFIHNKFDKLNALCYNVDVLEKSKRVQK